MSILVIGSTGHIGSLVVEQLIAKGGNVTALIHKTEAKFSKDVPTVKGDVTDPETMREAFKGIDTLFVLNPVVADELNRALLTLDLAVEAGIRRVVYFSMFHADTFLDCPHACAKYATELMLQKFQIPATILRPNYFFQNDGEPVTKTHVYPMPIGSLGVSMVDARDIAEVAALELIRRDTAAGLLPPALIEIHGPDVITAESAIKTWSDVLNKKVIYPGDDLKIAEKQLRKKIPGNMAYDVTRMFAGFQREGMVARPEMVDKVIALLGRPLRTYQKYAEEMSN